MKKHSIIIIITVFSLVLVASTAMAWGPGYGRDSNVGLGYGSPPVSNLTPEQSSKIQAIRAANLNEIAPLREQLYVKRTELRNLWHSQNPDQGQIKALQEDMLNVRAQLQEKTTNARFQMRALLTPEQLAEMTAYGPGMGRMGGYMGQR